MLTDVEPMCPTRGYRAHHHNGWLIDLRDEVCGPTGTQSALTVTTLVPGSRARWWCSGATKPTFDLVLRGRPQHRDRR